MHKILVSSCLLGEKVRYDGGDSNQNNLLLRKWQEEGRVMTICPEVASGLSVPRLPAEILNSKVINSAGIDVTLEFHNGAHLALELCKKHKIKFALLKSKSPSCGNRQIYDGSFSRNLIEGQGITAALLNANNIQVFNETEIQKLLDLVSDY